MDLPREEGSPGVIISETWKGGSRAGGYPDCALLATLGTPVVRGRQPLENLVSRIPTPADIEAAPAAARPLLEGVRKQLGVVPNMFRLISNSPAALEGYLALSEALGKGTLAAPTRERIALAVAEENRCDYCLSAHTYLGRNLARLPDSEIAANRRGQSHDAKADPAVRFAVEVARSRGHVDERALQAVRAAGYGDAQVVEIVLHVALNTWTNMINGVGATDIDFPRVSAGAFA